MLNLSRVFTICMLLIALSSCGSLPELFQSAEKVLDDTAIKVHVSQEAIQDDTDINVAISVVNKDIPKK